MVDYPIDVAPVNDVDAVIHAIHSATGNEERWDTVIARIRQLFNSASTAIVRHQFSSGQGKLIYQAPVDEALRIDYADKFSVRNPWFMASSEYIAGRVMCGEELVSREALIKSDFYQQFLKQYGLFHRLCGVITRYPDNVYYLAIYRGLDQVAFSPEDKQLLQHLLSHLSLSLEYHWRLLHAEGLNQLFWSVIDRFENAAFLVTRDGVLLHRNNKADEFIQSFGGITLNDGRIEATSALEQRALITAINEVADASAEHLVDVNKIITLSRSHIEYPIIVTLRPIGNTFSVETGDYQNIIILTARNPIDSSHPHSCSFSKLYELTPAQARLSALVFSGHTMTDAAKRLHISENTVRSHLKQIYLKTNTHGQMELMQLHTRICDDHF